MKEPQAWISHFQFTGDIGMRIWPHLPASVGLADKGTWSRLLDLGLVSGTHLFLAWEAYRVSVGPARRRAPTYQSRHCGPPPNLPHLCGPVLAHQYELSMAFAQLQQISGPRYRLPHRATETSDTGGRTKDLRCLWPEHMCRLPSCQQLHSHEWGSGTGV